MTVPPKPLPTNSDDTEIKRKKLTQYCLKSLNLEGIEPDQEALEQLELLDSGKISMDEFLTRMLKKAGVDKSSVLNKPS